MTAATRIRCDFPPPAAPPYRISVASDSNANSCLGCSSRSSSASTGWTTPGIQIDDWDKFKPAVDLELLLEHAEMLADIDQRRALVVKLESHLADVARVLAAAVLEVFHGERSDRGRL